MKFSLKYSPNELVQSVVIQVSSSFGISFSFNDSGHLVIDDGVNEDALKQAIAALGEYGINLKKFEETSIVTKIKLALDELIYSEDMRKTTVSSYLCDKLGYSYSYLSNLFSEETYSSIENFIILRKIEYAKKLILEGQMNLTQIAFKLDYSSVAHLSGQFKKVTGLTPTAFVRIVEKRATKNT